MISTWWSAHIQTFILHRFTASYFIVPANNFFLIILGRNRKEYIFLLLLLHFILTFDFFLKWYSGCQPLVSLPRQHTQYTWSLVRFWAKSLLAFAFLLKPFLLRSLCLDNIKHRNLSHLCKREKRFSSQSANYWAKNIICAILVLFFATSYLVRSLFSISRSYYCYSAKV